MLTHRLPFAPNRGDRIRAFHLLRLLESTYRIRLISLVHDREEERQLTQMQEAGTAVIGVRSTPWRNYARALAFLASERPLTHAMLHGGGIKPILKAASEWRP